MFTRMGFTASEMIQLVACGHTMGGVRSSDFPNLVAPNPTEPDVPNFDTFDTTTMQFDNKVYVGKITFVKRLQSSNQCNGISV